MPKYLLTLAYDGTDFHGWQRQIIPEASGSADQPESKETETDGERGDEPAAPNELRTVQAELQRAVREAVREPVVIHGASRTDSGVHALGQRATFSSSPDPSVGRGWPGERGLEPLIRAINARLPDDALVTAAEIVPDDFDVISAAVDKQYTYTFFIAPDRPLFERRFVHHVWRDLDVSKMHVAAERLVGERDFAAFATSGHGRLTTVRTLHTCEVFESPAMAEPASPLHDGPRSGDAGRGDPGPRTSGGDGGSASLSWPAPRLVTVRVSGSGFLWNMVRIIAGTLMEAGRDRISPEQIDDALRTGDRRLAGPTLPAQGLRLDWIRYAHTEPGR